MSTNFLHGYLENLDKMKRTVPIICTLYLYSYLLKEISFYSEILKLKDYCKEKNIIY